MRQRVPYLILTFLLSACSDTKVIVPTSPSGVGGSPVQPVTVNKIEYRVTGNALGAQVRFSNAIDGLTQVVTTLPYTATITTKDTSIFLSLEGTPTGYSFLNTFPFFAVQIFVNGTLFREDTSSGFILNTLSVSGTWRQSVSN